MTDNIVVSQVPASAEEQLHRANIIIDRLRDHLTAVTENLIAEQADNVILGETIAAQHKAISMLVQQLNPELVTAHEPPADTPEVVTPPKASRSRKSTKTVEAANV